jgi:hypothetical protein
MAPRTTKSTAEKVKEQTFTKGVFVALDEEGNLSGIQAVGDVRPTEVPTILEVSIDVARQNFGLKPIKS